jgi:hypothetical protein
MVAPPAADVAMLRAQLGSGDVHAGLPGAAILDFEALRASVRGEREQHRSGEHEPDNQHDPA